MVDIVDVGLLTCCVSNSNHFDWDNFVLSFLTRFLSQNFFPLVVYGWCTCIHMLINKHAATNRP